MARFLARRLLFTVISLLGATMMVFGLSHAKEDPSYVFFGPESYGITKEQIEFQKKKWGLDRPLVVQYGIWLRNVVTGDLGNSITTRRPVADLLLERAGPTFQLAIAAWIFGTVVGIPLGILSAVKRGTAWDYLGRGLALFGQALPSFWVAIVSILIFAVWLGLLPAATRGAGEPFFTQLKYFVLPTIVLGSAPLAGYLRITRSSMLEVLDSEYIKLAKAKGVNNRMVVWKHALRNALIQPLTVAALLLAGFLDGSVLVESVFAWPGLGQLAVQAVSTTDYPVLSAAVLFFAAIFLFMNILADITYALIDPRIRYQ